MELFEQLVVAENKFFAYFGYTPILNRYPEHHPILDFRNHFWLLLHNDGMQAVCHSAQPLTGLSLEAGQGIYFEEILTWLGTNRKTGARGGIWRGKECTLVAAGLPDDKARRYLLFSNTRESRNPFLAKLARAQFLV